MRGGNGIRPGGSLPHRLRAEPLAEGAKHLASLCEGGGAERRRERTSQRHP